MPDSKLIPRYIRHLFDWSDIGDGQLLRRDGDKVVGVDMPSDSGAGGDMLSQLLTAEVAVTGGTTLTDTAFGKMHVCSGTSADYTVGLPAASGNAGKFIGFRMAAALTKLVTLDGDGAETIDGAASRILWAEESAILMCDGGGWIKIAGKSRPMTCRVRVSASQFIPANTGAQLQLNTVVQDDAGMADTSNYRLRIPRTSRWMFTTQVQLDVITSGVYAELNITNDASAAIGLCTIPAVTYMIWFAAGSAVLEGGDHVFVMMQLGAASSLATFSYARDFLSADEIPTW